MITPHIEKEYKMMIDESTYNLLLNDLKITPFKQVNYYYETHLKTCAIRIREINNKYIFTLKEKGNGYKKEYEFEIETNSLDYPKVKDLLKEFDIKDPKYLGYMVTYRSILKLRDGEICIDKSEYNNKTDYEIEYELFDYQKDNFNEFELFLEKYKLVFIPSKETKYRRFLNTI